MSPFVDREGPLTNRSSNPFKSHDILNDLMSCIGNFQVGDPQLLSLAKKLYRQLSGREEKEVRIDFEKEISINEWYVGVTVCV